MGERWEIDCDVLRASQRRIGGEHEPFKCLTTPNCEGGRERIQTIVASDFLHKKKYTSTHFSSKMWERERDRIETIVASDFLFIKKCEKITIKQITTITWPIKIALDVRNA